MRQAAVGLAAATLREYFLDLVDPQHHGRHRLRERRGLTKISLRLADVFVVEPAGVEFEERKVPLAGDELRSQRFSATLNANEKNAFRRIEIELARRGREPDLRAIEPRFQPLESAELELVRVDRKKLEDAAVLDQLPLPLDDLLEIVHRQTSVVDNRRSDHLSSLVQRQ